MTEHQSKIPQIIDTEHMPPTADIEQMPPTADIIQILDPIVSLLLLS
jgi:hypothetical protein